MTDLDTLLDAVPATQESASTVVGSPRRVHRRHLWSIGDDLVADPPYPMVCRGCGAVRDPVRSRRGRTSRNRGNSFERDVAARLGARRVGQYGAADDVAADWISVQCKVGGAYPQRIDGWLRALPANADQLRAVVIGDAPGAGHRRRTLIVLDFEDFVAWFGKAA